MKFIIKLFASSFGLGLVPKAPGTFGTLAGVGLFYLLSFLPIVHYLIFLVVFILFASWMAGEASAICGESDPGWVTIDEVAGFMVTMTGFAWNIKYVIAGFVLFRLFDIWKPFPIRQAEQRLTNGFGVVMDDVLAGVYAWGCLTLIAKGLNPHFML